MGAGEKTLPETLTAALIAPCGMDCGLCRAHLRAKKRCAGCNASDDSKPRYCAVCRIKTCDEISSGAATYCFECARFPCAPLRQLDRRYRTTYRMSMVENLRSILEIGVDGFVASEKQRWTCPGCGALLCVHRRACSTCGREWNPPSEPPSELERLGHDG